MNERQFDDLVRAHGGAVAAYARAVCRDRWTAEDAVQETFARAWKYVDSYRGDGSFEGWLLRICRNCIIDLASRVTPEPVEELPELAAAPDASHEIYDVLERLPLAQREVVVLVGLLGYGYDAAAALLDVPAGTVRSRLHRARIAIAEELCPAAIEESA